MSNSIVIPAKAGTHLVHSSQPQRHQLGSRLRGNDGVLS